MINCVKMKSRSDLHINGCRNRLPALAQCVAVERVFQVLANAYPSSSGAVEGMMIPRISGLFQKPYNSAYGNYFLEGGIEKKKKKVLLYYWRLLCHLQKNLRWNPNLRLKGWRAVMPCRFEEISQHCSASLIACPPSYLLDLASYPKCALHTH